MTKKGIERLKEYTRRFRTSTHERLEQFEADSTARAVSRSLDRGHKVGKWKQPAAVLAVQIAACYQSYNEIVVATSVNNRGG